MLRSNRLVQLFVQAQGLQEADHLVNLQLLLISGASANHHADTQQPLNGPEPWCQLLKDLIAAHQPQSVLAAEGKALHGLAKAVQKVAAPARAKYQAVLQGHLSKCISSTELPMPDQANLEKLVRQCLGDHLDPDEDELDQQGLQASEQTLHDTAAHKQHTLQDACPALRMGGPSSQADSAASGQENFVTETGSHHKAPGQAQHQGVLPKGRKLKTWQGLEQRKHQ